MPTNQTTAIDAYLDLMKKSLTYSLWGETLKPHDWSTNNLFNRTKYRILEWLLARKNLRILSVIPYDPEKRRTGLDWPILADTMIGHVRLENVRQCVEDCLAKGVPGDLMEAGVWRGGAAIYMRAILKAHGDEKRVVWAADSFAGCPPPDPEKYPADRGDEWYKSDFLAVPLEEVQRRFRNYDLLDDRVRFLHGWFKDTLPSAPIDRLAVLRIDGDLYESTMDVLGSMYEKVSRGGYVIVDDYALAGCKQAVDDFRRSHDIRDELRTIDWTGVYWQRS